MKKKWLYSLQEAVDECNRLSAELDDKDKLIEHMRTTLIAARNGLLIACDDDENNSRFKRFFNYIDSALAAERRTNEPSTL